MFLGLLESKQPTAPAQEAERRRTWTAATEICGRVQSIQFVGTTPSVQVFKEALAARLSLSSCSLDVMDLMCRGNSVTDNVEFRRLLESGAVFRIGVVSIPSDVSEDFDIDRLATPYTSEALVASNQTAPAAPAVRSQALVERYTALSNAQSDLHLKHQGLQAEVQRLRSDIAAMANELATFQSSRR
mmetsp:Transcript_15142/g.34476  ORF Transcript_15142/g.34476 Transcript_15142/m.34476 type:complete len:187 (+) Transcript_15142:65-625(+)